MLGFHPTDHFEPSTLGEVSSLLTEYGKNARVIAGGTAVYELVKRGMASDIRQIISLRKLNLSYVRPEQDGLHIGSTTTISQLLESPHINADPALRVVSEALREIRPVQVRNVATIGGEVCTSLPLLDLPAALLAVDASAIIFSSTGERSCALTDFLIDLFLNALRRGEFLREVLIPRQPERSGSAFIKFGRTAYDFNLVNVATRLAFSVDNVCTDARIVLGGVGRTPLRASVAEEDIVGHVIDEPRILHASASLGEFKAIPQIHGSVEYKRAIAEILIRDSLKRALERAGGLSK
jgi:CO/xanthine dehydrogenase FAD-binding subunit